MLLRALYDFAHERRLLEGLPIQDRPIHLCLPLTSAGELVGPGVIPLFQRDARGKDKLGLDLPMPRFPGENNGGKAYFLAESCVCVFGRDKDTGNSISSESGNPAKAFRYFWLQIAQAYRTSRLPSLKALLRFKRKYLQTGRGAIRADIPWLESRLNRNGKLEFGIRSAPGGWEKLKTATLTFQVETVPVFDGKDSGHPLTRYWFELYPRLAFADDEDESASAAPIRKGLCILSEQADQPVARSHKPKILGVPNLSSGGYVVSFAKDSPAFSSYGFEMGENCSISEAAAASYALALNYLLDREEHSLRIGSLKVCFWAKQNQKAMSFVGRLLTKPQSLEVREFMLTPFSGVPRDALRLDRFYSATLTGNAWRVVVRHWLDEPLDQAAENLQQWFRDLDILGFPRSTESETSHSNIEALCAATVRDPKDLVAEMPAQLYRAALEGTTVSIVLIKRVLRRLEADLAKYGDCILETHLLKNKEGFLIPQLHPSTQKKFRDANQPVPPSGQTRMALLKLILNRNRKETDMAIESKLADTSDVAYNCGRLLAVFDALQWRAHEGQLEGPGVVERYFGTASASPNSAFNILWRLHVHHLKKLTRLGDKGASAAYAIESRIAEICALFGQTTEMRAKRIAPHFPRVLDLQAQGRFALGFYQQKAADAEAIAQARADKQQTSNSNQNQRQ
jgi:CRISPR-associated protein Csd1